jgi:hypothetical protein
LATDDTQGGDPNRSSAGNYRLRAGSPALDAARADYSLEVDLDGCARPQGPASDVGAYER